MSNKVEKNIVLDLAIRSLFISIEEPASLFLIWSRGNIAYNNVLIGTK